MLNVNDDRAIAKPTEAQLRDELAKLGEEEFLILSRSDQEYLQTYREEDGSYTVEYRDGSHDEHYGAEVQEVEVLEPLFVAYVRKQADWQVLLCWEKVEFDADFEGDMPDEEFAELPTPE